MKLSISLKRNFIYFKVPIPLKKSSSAKLVGHRLEKQEEEQFQACKTITYFWQSSFHGRRQKEFPFISLKPSMKTGRKNTKEKLADIGASTIRTELEKAIANLFE